MGKIKQVIMGDEQSEEKTRKKAEVKREQKKLREGEETTTIKKKKIASPSTRNDKSGSGKKYLAAQLLIDKNKNYSASEAIDLVKQASFSKFDGTFEAHINTFEKGLRGTVALPHGTGKEIKVRIADDALIANPVINFDILVAHPLMMPKLAKIAKILGPKGLMPNPKTGTIGENVEELALRFRSGQQSWKTQPDFPIIHTIIGKVSFDTKKLEENLAALVKSISRDKIVSLFLKSTMSPSVKVAI